MRPPPAPDFESRSADWLSFEEARRRILAQASVLPSETVPLAEALGRVLASDVDADIDLPPWDNSAMDGYAVRAADLAGAAEESPVTLSVIGAVHAGDGAELIVTEGGAVRIMTGAPVPSGADSVVRVEDTDREAEAGKVRIFSDRDSFRSVRPGGEDVRSGERVADRGLTVGPGAIALLASIGRPNVAVVQKPSVAILPTGNELRPPEDYDDVRAGLAIAESNSPMLAAAVREAGGQPMPLPIAADDLGELAARLDAAADADVLVTIGGASMGEADLMKDALDAAGFELDFWRVKIRPGSPFSFGWLERGDRRQPVFGLPGNPTSAFVTFEILVRPFLRAVGGHADLDRPRLVGVATESIRAAGELMYFPRIRLERAGDDWLAHPAGPQGSGLVRPLSVTQGLGVIPESVESVDPGDAMEIIVVDAALTATLGLG